MAERGKTRKQLVASTVELLRRQGAYGTGLQDVLTHSGAPRGSLYFHFPGGKEDLAGAGSHPGRGWRARSLTPKEPGPAAERGGRPARLLWTLRRAAG